MTRIRVLLAEMPRILSGVFRQAVADQPDMEIVGDLVDPIGVLLAAGQTQADVVVLGLYTSELPGICSHLLSEFPNIKVLGVSADGRQAFLYNLQPQKVPIGEVSAQSLLEAIRTAMHGTDPNVADAL